MCPILVSMASLLTSCNNTIMQNTPSNGAGRRLAPHPFLAIILSPSRPRTPVARGCLLHTCFSGSQRRNRQ